MVLTTKDTKSTKEKINKVGKGSTFTFTLPIQRLLHPVEYYARLRWVLSTETLLHGGVYIVVDISDNFPFLWKQKPKHHGYLTSPMQSYMSLSNLLKGCRLRSVPRSSYAKWGTMR